MKSLIRLSLISSIKNILNSPIKFNSKGLTGINNSFDKANKIKDASINKEIKMSNLKSRLSLKKKKVTKKLNF